MTIFKKFLSIPGVTLLALLLAVPAFAANVPVSLVAEAVTATMPDGASVPMWGLRDSVANPTANTASIPGPTIRAVAGDSLIITLTSTLPEPTSLVINGQTAVETDAMVPTWTDGSTGPRPGGNYTMRVRSFTHETTAADTGGIVYQWDNLRPGTYLIESGSHQAVQIPMGLYAVLVVDEVANAQAYPDASTAYTNDAVLVFSEVDPVLNAAVDAGTYGTPAYTTSMGEGYLPRYFLINGSSYATGSAVPVDLGVSSGSKLLRFVNAGSRTRNPVLQGPYMTLIAEDGFPSPYPLQQYAIYLPAGKTIDAQFTPAAEGTLALYDRSLGLTNDMTSPGGMVASLQVGPVVPAAMVSPADTSTLAGASQTFTWTDVSASNYVLHFGTTPGGSDIIVIYPTPSTATSTTVGGLPVDGSTVYVRLWSEIGGVWYSNDYTYTAFGP
ncbi:MAG TPA: multicopper oxidase domain-containing protein [Geothermobacteraceae bacterium]|nr:multicopper oxidase domain-containing protein [Geothermobacteraceae bacterium]